MKAQIKRQELLQALKDIKPVIPNKSAMPALHNALLEFNNNCLVISGTDLSNQVKIKIDGTVEGEDNIAIVFNELYNLVSKTKGENLLITKNDNELILKFQIDGLDISISGMSKDDYPTLREMSKHQEVKLSSEEFQTGLRKVETNRSIGNISSIINGIYVEMSKSGSYMTATNGHRLGMYTINKKLKEKDKTSFTISPDIIPLIAKFNYDNMYIDKEKQLIYLVSDKKTIISRNLEGEYPPSKAVLDGYRKKITGTINVNKIDLLATLESILPFTPERSNLIKFTLSKDNVKVDTTSEKAEVSKTINCPFNGEQMEIGMNCTYIIDILKLVDSLNEIKISFGDPESAIIIESIEDINTIYLLMPIKLI